MTAKKDSTIYDIMNKRRINKNSIQLSKVKLTKASLRHWRHTAVASMHLSRKYVLHMFTSTTVLKISIAEEHLWVSAENLLYTKNISAKMSNKEVCMDY
jgi:hypothetical protein